MATLIQSKQIQGVVTASVVSGEFQVSGSTNLTGSVGVQGSLTATSFIGDGSQLTFNGTGLVSGSQQVIISQVSGYNTFSSSLDSRLVSLENATDDTGSDSQTLSISGDQLTISSGNTITIPTGSSVSNQTLSFNQVSQQLTITDGNSVDLSSLAGGGGGGGSSIWTTGSNFYKVSSDLQVTGSFSATSLTGSIDYSNLTNVPSGLVSSSVQITNGSGIVSGSVLTTLNGTDVVSGSVLRTLNGTDVVSGSVLRTLDGTSVLSASVTFEQYSASVQTTIDNISHTQIPAGTISGSAQITALGFVSESGDSVPAGTISGSAQITALGFISESLTSLGGTNVLSSSTDFETYSSSVDSRIDTEKTRIDNILSGANADYDQFVEIVELVNSTDTTNDIAFANHYTSSRQRLTSLETTTSSLQTQIDALVAETSSYLTSETDSQILSISGDQLTISNGNTVTIPTGSNLPNGVISGSQQITDLGFISSSHTQIPSGTVSSSQQIDDLGFLKVNGDGVVSGSVLRTLDGTDVVSGSVLRTLDGTGVVSGSVLRPNGDDVISGSVLRNLGGTLVISSSQQVINNLKGSNVLSGSILPGEGITINSGSGNYIISSSFDGDRTVSNTDLPSGVYNNNFGTSGSVQDFLNAVFFPNSAPAISTGNQTIQEFSGSGATIVTLSGTDAEGQSLTWGTASAYTDDLVRVASNGVMTLNATATSASFNTDLISGTTYGHQVTVTATDTFNAETEKDIYIIVTPNEAPKFRETSVAGNVITSVTQAVNENSSDNTLIKRIYFTDNESDSITITSSSILPSEHFTITKSSTYVDIRQNTGSLDYENITQYTFSITASDEHYPAQDSNAVTTLPITINVTDNIVPSISNQTISGLNENSSNGASAGSISATDSEGDAITFVSFDLHKLLLDGSAVTSGSYGGTSQASDPHENPFQMDSSGNVTRKTGVYLNSDLINSYQYRVKVKDNFNATNSTAGIISIPVADDSAPTISTNGTFRIVESATSGNLVRTSSNGYSGTQARLTSNQSVTWSDDSGMISINGSGYISLSSNVDGVYTSGQSFTANVTATNSFGTTTTQSITINVVANGAPTISFTNQTSNFETDLALSGVTMVSMSVTDQESDTPYSASLTGTNASDLQLKYVGANSSSIGLQAASNLSAGTYTYNIKVTDNYGKSTTYSNRSFVVETSSDYGKTYIYRSPYGSDAGLSSNYLALMGASTVSGDTPPEVTAYTANDESPFRLISSSLGDSSLSLAGGVTATLVATISGSDLDTILTNANPFTMGNVGEQYIIVVPSGSDMVGIPTSMTDSFGDNTVGRYVMAIAADGGSYGAELSTIHLIDTVGSINGYDKHFVIGRQGQNAASSVEIRIIEASGSLPS